MWLTELPDIYETHRRLVGTSPMLWRCPSRDILSCTSKRCAGNPAPRTEGSAMRFMKTTAAAASLAIAAFAFTPPALADADDAIIAGAAGFAAGTILGNATARPHYVPPQAVYGPT